MIIVLSNTNLSLSLWLNNAHTFQMKKKHTYLQNGLRAMFLIWINGQQTDLIN